MKRLAVAVAVVVLMTCAHAVPASAVGDDSTAQPPAGSPVAPASISIATYNGRTIDLRHGWQGAGACHVDARASTTCFETEAQMDAFIDANRRPGNASGLKSSARANCATNLRLYDGISYGGFVLDVAVRLTIVNLSGLGFDNATTSYRVGACSAVMWAGASGGGGAYPGNTSAGAQSPNMVAGWNNTISSVYLF
jgi:hypothetical protein